MKPNALSVGTGRSVFPLNVEIMNRIMSSPLWLPALAAITCLAFAFSKEFEFYCFALTYAVLVSLFARDLSPLMPLFVFCYIVPSAENNPGKNEASIFSGASGIFLFAAVSVVVVLIFARIALDEDMGFTRLFTEYREMALGMLILGGAYMLSGIGTDHYGEYALRNLLFAFIQFASIFLLYFIFSATINWSTFKPSYFAAIGLMMGAVVAFELLYLYIAGDVIVDGQLTKDHIYTGWGISNNIGALLTMSIPFCFYFACRFKVSAPFILLAVGFLIAVFFTASRTASLFGVIIFIASFVFTLMKTDKKLEMTISGAALLVIGIVLVIIFKDKLAFVFDKVQQIFKVDGNELGVNDSGRIELYKNGLRAFRDAPFFGQTFYPVKYNVYDFSTNADFSSFFPPRWHNTIVQVLASSGAVGIAAYIFHRATTVMTYIKHRSVTNTFFFISIGALLGMSLLDCHFFNVGPVLFYSMMLAVIEFSSEEDCFSPL